MQAWGGISLTNVNAGGSLTQLYPNFVPAGSGVSPNAVLTRRCPTDGVLGRAEFVPSSGVGGTLELYDIAGELTGTNDVNAGTTMTNAYLSAALAAGRAHLLWKTDFAGTLTGSDKLLGVRVVFARGLAARFIQSDAPGTNTLVINIVCAGGFRLYEGNLPA